MNAEIISRLEASFVTPRLGGLFGLAPPKLDDDTEMLLRAMELYASRRRKERGE